MIPRGILPYIYSARYLQPRQFIGRARRAAGKLLDPPSRYARLKPPPYPGSRPAPAAPALEFLPPTPPGADSSHYADGEFGFLNSERTVGFPPDWISADMPRLWQYQLHYLDYIWHMDFKAARRWAIDWIGRNPPGNGSAAWEPYPVSLRLSNICNFFWGRHRVQTESDPQLTENLWDAIFRQAEFLRRHLETDLLCNHLLENGAALALAGSYFAGGSAAVWRRIGAAILREQVAEQFLPDGGHIERSPMYHARATWLLAALCRAGVDAGGLQLETTLRHAAAALRRMMHPDGDIALIHDSATGMYARASEILDYALETLRQDTESREGRIFALPSSGYYGFDGGGDYLLCDFGGVSPDYNPGHIHGGIFSFELSLNGSRVIVDSGVHGYRQGELRDYSRSTRAHNTVEIEGCDQSEFWASHRVARRAHVSGLEWRPLGKAFMLEARHDGYSRLKQRPVHKRELHWKGQEGLAVRDEIQTDRPVSALSRLHLHPECRIVSQNSRSVKIEHPGGRCRIVFKGKGRMSPEESSYFPEFGLRRPNVCLCWTMETMESGFEIHTS